MQRNGNQKVLQISGERYSLPSIRVINVQLQVCICNSTSHIYSTSANIVCKVYCEEVHHAGSTVYPTSSISPEVGMQDDPNLSKPFSNYSYHLCTKNFFQPKFSGERCIVPLIRVVNVQLQVCICNLTRYFFFTFANIVCKVYFQQVGRRISNGKI